MRLIRQLCSEQNAASIPQKLKDILSGHTEVSPPPPPPQAESIPVPPQRDLNASSNNHEVGHISNKKRATHKPVQQQPQRILDEGTREIQTDTDDTEGQNDSLPPQNSDMHAGEGSEHPPQITRPMQLGRGQKRQNKTQPPQTRGTSRWACFNSKGKVDGLPALGPKIAIKTKRKTVRMGQRQLELIGETTSHILINGPARAGPSVPLGQKRRITAPRNRAKQSKQRASINLDPKGFVQVEVDYEHRLAIAAACGSSLTMVTRATRR